MNPIRLINADDRSGLTSGLAIDRRAAAAARDADDFDGGGGPAAERPRA